VRRVFAFWVVTLFLCGPGKPNRKDAHMTYPQLTLADTPGPDDDRLEKIFEYLAMADRYLCVASSCFYNDSDVTRGRAVGNLVNKLQEIMFDLGHPSVDDKAVDNG
jgi:hypothetical protein